MRGSQTVLVADPVALAAGQAFAAVNPIIRPDLPVLVDVGADPYVLPAGRRADVVVANDLQALATVRGAVGVLFWITVEDLVEVDLANGNTGATGLAGVAEHGVPVHPVTLAQPGSQGAEVAAQANVLAIAGLDGDKDTVIYVGLVASGEGHAPAGDGRPDRASFVHEVVDGELIVCVVRL